VTRVGEATPPPPPGPLEISDVRLVYVSASAARISWHTNLPTLGRAVYGIDEPTVWAPADVPGLDHEAVLGGLAFSKTYDVAVRALDDWGRVAAADLELTTQPLGERQTAESRSGAILVDGQPVFPLMVWHLCSDGYAKHIADGINLFMGDDCDETSMPELLDGRAYSLVANTNSELDGPGVLGWYYRDEWDAFLPSNVSQADLQKELVPPKPGRLSFLTLTNHFYSHADPLPQGKGMYPTLATVSDALGFDLYPLQVWCRPSFGHVFESQREIQQLASGKPTFQWIETAPMEHPCRNDHRLDPNPATVRAETWLAVAGGASGIGYFPNHWKRDIGEEIAQTNRRLTSLAPVLIGPSSVASTDAGAVNVGVRQLNDALYVIAVNTSAEKVDAKISVKDLRGRGLTVLGEARTVSATDDTFSDTFEPLAVHVYVVGPDGWPVQS
jgi:hypothetical protein